MSELLLSRRNMMQMTGGGGTDTDCILVAEFDTTIPEQTSSAQTVNADFSPSISAYRAADKPFLVEMSYSGTYPTAPEKETQVKFWFIGAPHANTDHFWYDYKGWYKSISTSGTETFPAGYTLNQNKCIAISWLRDTRMQLNVKAAVSGIQVQAGTWHIKLYALTN